MLSGKCVVLGITGGIAAYKAADVASRLVKQGCDVVAVFTKNGARFVTPLTLDNITHNPSVTDMFDSPRMWEVEHIALAKRADAFVIAPATANFIGKMACGICDDMLTTTVTATKAPVIIAPAMNTGMWENVNVQRNVHTLREQGVVFVDPEYGRLAEGMFGVGRLANPEKIVECVINALLPRLDMEGLNVLVTAGPTREAIDPVRYITNKSSGRMGYAIAARAKARGACVTLVSGPVSITRPAGVEMVDITTTQELYEALRERAARCDVLIQAAAPADYRMKDVAAEKIKKRGGELTLTLVENIDVAAALGAGKRAGQTFVAFAAETGDLIENAQKKLAKKNADLMVANDVTMPGAGFDVDTNIVTLIDARGATPLPMMKKDDVADAILTHILSLRV